MADELLDAMLASHDELRRWMTWAQTTPTPDSLRALIRRGEEEFDANREWNYALFERDSLALVGSAGLKHVDDPDCPEIGYWVRTDRTGRGYATASARALTHTAFVALPEVSAVQIRMDRANRASAAVPPKLGFQLVREEDREMVASGHTGRGYVWIALRDTLAAP